MSSHRNLTEFFSNHENKVLRKLNRPSKVSTFLYFSFIFGITFLISFFMAGMVDFHSGVFIYSVIWFTGFAFLTFNLVYMLGASVFYLISAPQIAILHVLDTTLETTIAALTATHADLLWDSDLGIQFDRWSNPALARDAADILEQAQELRYAIAAYGPDLTPPWESAPRQLGLSFDEGDEIPF